MPGVKKEKIISKETNMEYCDLKKVKEAVKALRLLHTKTAEDLKKQPLLEDISECPVYLQVLLKKIPPPQLLKMIRVHLPHSLLTETSEVCLITGDLEKGNHKAEVEPTVLHYKDLLRKNGVTRVSEVIPLRQLRTEYKTFESKRQLAAAYDVFLVDKMIAGVLPKTLGKKFFQKRKFPIQIDMKTANLKDQIDKALCTSEFSLTCRGNSYALEVARFSMEDDAIVENTMLSMEALGKQLPGNENNILSFYLKTARSKAIPLYVSLDTSDNIVFKKSRKNGSYQRGELSTMDDTEVKVFQNGRVILKRKKKLSNCEDASESDEEINLIEDFSDDELMESDEAAEESDSNEDSLTKKSKNKKASKLNEINKKGGIQGSVAKALGGKKKKDKKPSKLIVDTTDTVMENEEDNQDSTSNEVPLKKKKKGKKYNFNESINITQMENEDDNQDSTANEVSPKKKKKGKKSANFDEAINIVELRNEEDNQDSTANVVSPKKKKGKKSANFNEATNIAQMENEDNQDSNANVVSPKKKKKGKKSANFNEAINIVELENEDDNQNSNANVVSPKKKKGKKSTNFNESINIVELENEQIQNSVNTEISSKKRKRGNNSILVERRSEDETPKTPMGSKKNKKMKKESTGNTTGDSILSNVEKADVDSNINNSLVKLNKRRKSNRKSISVC